MRYIFFATIFIVGQAQANFFFVHKGKIYSAHSNYSPEKTSIEKANFLKISAKENRKNGIVRYKAEGIVSPGSFTLEKAPATSKIIPSEGCAENPMSWLKTSKVIGYLNKKDSAIYVQIPNKFISLGKTAVKCPSGDRFSENSLQLSAGDNDLAVLICSDDLNHNLLVVKKSSVEADLVITENCP